MKSLWIAFAMYSRLPAPMVDWDKKSLSMALCWFPVIGIISGAILYGWRYLAELLALGDVLTAAFSLLIPIFICGAIHMDGFCDTVDALSSQQSRERKIEILKDTHAGAFAIIFCGLYLLAFFAVWVEVGSVGWRETVVLCLTPVLSRSLSGLWCTLLPNARGSGLLATFTTTMDGIKARVILALWVVVTLGVMAWIQPLTTLGVIVGGLLACGYYLYISHRQFGGITGDLAGFFLQICELMTVLGAVLAWRVAVVMG